MAGQLEYSSYVWTPLTSTCVRWSLAGAHAWEIVANLVGNDRFVETFPI